MNGAMTDPCVRTIKAPNSSNIMIIGASQNFLRSLMNAHKSFNSSIIRRAAPRDRWIVFGFARDNYPLFFQFFLPLDLCPLIS